MTILSRNGGPPRHAAAYVRRSDAGHWEAHILDGGLRQLDLPPATLREAMAAADAAMPEGANVEPWRDITRDYPCPTCFTPMAAQRQTVAEQPMFTADDMRVCPACHRADLEQPLPPDADVLDAGMHPGDIIVSHHDAGFYRVARVNGRDTHPRSQHLGADVTLDGAAALAERNSNGRAIWSKEAGEHEWQGTPACARADTTGEPCWGVRALFPREVPMQHNAINAPDVNAMPRSRANMGRPHLPRSPARMTHPDGHYRRMPERQRRASLAEPILTLHATGIITS